MASLLLPLMALASTVKSQSLTDLCSTSNVQKSLSPGNLTGITFDQSSITATPVYNATVQSNQDSEGGTGFNYCNVTLAYSHDGINDNVQVRYFLPASNQFKNRFLATGGGGEAINSGDSGLTTGLVYGAASGMTDGGFGSFSAELTDVLNPANGSIEYRYVFNFGYLSIHEMSEIGKALTKNYYSASNKVYSYYHGCSEGGREGWSQVQRYGDQFDGAAIGAPAFRQAFQQVNHLVAGVTERTMGYAPPPCELERIVNDTIAACDELDGKKDGVVSRTDLCKLHYNVSSSIGNTYSCAASSSMMGTTPAANGTVTAKGAAVAAQLNEGLHDSKGRRVYIPYQPSATYDDAQTTYNATSGEWYAAASGIGLEWVNQFLKQIDSSELSLDGVTYDTLRSWIMEGLQKYSDTLETTWPDLSNFHDAGGKVLHYHGESDPSIPADSSVIYNEAVRKTMYPDASYEDGFKQLHDWYRLFLVPGAAHCGPSTNQPNGPWPVTVLGTVIEWVENGNNPSMLNATVTQGDFEGKNEQLCTWPLRPMWTGSGNGTMQCVMPDQEVLDTWHPTFDSILLPVH